MVAVDLGARLIGEGAAATLGVSSMRSSGCCCPRCTGVCKLNSERVAFLPERREPADPGTAGEGDARGVRRPPAAAAAAERSEARNGVICTS